MAEFAAAQAEEFKKKGNDAFGAGNHDEAIQFYTQAISLDPDKHVFYSNRSAAYLAKGDAKSKALKDAEKCVKLKPDWVKGYSRLGAAQFALTRFQPAIETYQKGLKLDSTNVGFIEGIKNSNEAKVKYEAQKKKEAEAKATAEAAAKERAQADAMAKAAAEMVMEEMDEGQSKEDKEAEQVLEKKEKEAEDLLAGFFDEVSGLADDKNCVQKSEESKKRAAEYNPGTAEQQIARLLCKGYAFMNLNPYLVLELELDADTEDIKQRYRKLSTLVHPDKCKLDRTVDAFDQVKKAYNQLHAQT